MRQMKHQFKNTGWTVECTHCHLEAREDLPSFTAHRDAECIDTNTLVVGQVVHMVSNTVYALDGKVVKVKPDGVDVQTAQGLLQFDTTGCELESSRCVRLGFGPDSESKFHRVLWGAPEFQPWHLIQDSEAW
jgi:hypothetical protein